MERRYVEKENILCKTTQFDFFQGLYCDTLFYLLRHLKRILGSFRIGLPFFNFIKQFG